MTIWDEIDRLKTKFHHELEDTRNAFKAYGGVERSVKCDEFLTWRGKYIPAGDRAQKELSAKSGAGLVSLLKDIREAEQAKKKAG